MFRQTVLSILLLALTLPTTAQAFTGEVIRVADGDTITVLINSKEPVRVRLYGIDCPEKKQAFGAKAKAFTSRKVLGRTVEVNTIDTDRYGRAVAVITSQGLNLNEAILEAGYAWVYTRYCKKTFCSDWKEKQSVAFNAGVGLWSSPNPTPPWEFRKGNRGNENESHTAKGPLHGNEKSHVFHRLGCRYYDCKNCIVEFKNRKAAIKAGFKPCGLCKP